MGWASRYIEKLQRGESVKFRPRGNSMSGIIEDGQLVLISPFLGCDPDVGDVVLCKVRGREYLHQIKAKTSSLPTRFLIGNNRGHTNGWTGRDAVFGKWVGDGL